MVTINLTPSPASSIISRNDGELSIKANKFAFYPKRARKEGKKRRKSKERRVI